MKVEYSPIKLYSLVFVSSIQMWFHMRGQMFFIFCLVQLLFFLFIVMIAKELSFEVDEQGFHRNWMRIQKMKLKWDSIKRFRKIPFLREQYMIEKKWFSGVSFILLPMIFIKNKKEFLDYIRTHKPQLLSQPKDNSFRLTK
ncbi:hypothetical protein PQO01_04805 [Lentisphaera marina]|uniref:hypothetical protein n=1 Tax=Lentisphaera marina TaxID=1111041 RepID=UPI002366C118|nr:hypothetical protein [Lentisphaera marina]MDD7984265.1 hypothetical protein [Lentisphaera marina]